MAGLLADQKRVPHTGPSVGADERFLMEAHRRSSGSFMVQTTLEHSPPALEHPATIAQPPMRRRWRRQLSWLGGGTAGNEQLVATVGVVLIVLFALMGVTILRIHRLLAVHMFVGILLAGPVGLKLGATGYRFGRYYTGHRAYRRKGPPKLSLRLLAPVLVLSTLSLFLSGLVLMLEGASRSQRVVLLHKASFVIWIAVAGLHVLSHLPRVGKSVRAVRASHLAVAPGAAGRWAAVAVALVAGLALAIVLSAHFTA
jgi:hypothetical protein